MTLIERGKENKDVIILLHGGGLSWWSFRECAELLEDSYHVVMPILDGHSGSDKDFTTIESNALDLVALIDQKFNGKVFLIGGLSLGGQVLLKALELSPDITRYAIVESAPIIPDKLTSFLVKPMLDLSYGLIKKPWFSRLQFKELKIKPELFDEYFIDSSKITKENMIAFLKANTLFSLDSSISDTTAKAVIIAGSKERKRVLKSAEMLNRVIKNSHLIIKDGLYHGEFSINYAKEYAELINTLTLSH